MSASEAEAKSTISSVRTRKTSSDCFPNDMVIGASAERGWNLREFPLRRVGCVRIELPAVADDCFAEKSERTSRGINAPAVVTEFVVIFFHWEIRIGLKTLRFKETGPARGMDVKQMNHRGRKGKFQRDVVTNLNKHFI